ncbi:MAG TPA: HAMP domain-containing sensor histidine kinase [Opitutaceae bacterium]|nr:HAMP domain-containing sensor histidine kinase [Opitutaceae bacterium]
MQIPSVVRPVVLAAVHAAFREGEIVEKASVEEAQRTVAGGGELIVLVEPKAAAIAEAAQVTDGDGLPRWAVVVMGGGASELAETVGPEDWNAPLLARVFRSAALQHELLVENLRLQGDLRTVARRISHDLYTPVGCIYTSSQVLKIILSPDGTPSIAVMVRNIEDSSAEISQIIERVSFVLRASADPCAPGPLDMGGVVAGVLRQLETELQKAGADVALPDAWPDIGGVPQWLHVIWWNLIHNAVRHVGPGVRIRLAWTKEDRGHRFSVVDRGPGIATAMQPGLFRPFDQLHLLPAPGLGLSIVQRLVALQGGRCGYQQETDGSSVFFFTLPHTAMSIPAKSDLSMADGVSAARSRLGAGATASSRTVRTTLSRSVAEPAGRQASENGAS